MQHLAKISATGIIFLSLAGSVYAQSSMSGNQGNIDTTNTQMAPSTTSQSVSQTTTDQTKSQTVQNKNMPVTFTPDNIQWKDAKFFPPGAQYAMLEGNVKDKGPITVRIKIPANYQLTPVYSLSPEHITVLSGSLNLGIGDKIDTTAVTSLPAGSFVIIPARKHHYITTSEDTVVQLSGNGPMLFKYVNSKDDPRLHPSTQSQTPANSQNNSSAPGTTQSSQPTTNY